MYVAFEVPVLWIKTISSQCNFTTINRTQKESFIVARWF